MGFRADRDASAETCAKTVYDGFLRPCGSDRSAHIHGRAFGQSKNQVHLRAHKEIQTHMPLEPYDRKSFGLYPLSGFFIQNGARKSMVPNPTLRVSTADREMSAAVFRPKKALLAFSHVSAGATRSAPISLIFTIIFD